MGGWIRTLGIAAPAFMAGFDAASGHVVFACFMGILALANIALNVRPFTGATK